MPTPPTIGLPFEFDFDAVAHRRLRSLGLIRSVSAGFSLFKFPGKLRLLGFNPVREATQLAQRARREGWSAIVSHEDFFGAYCAAAAAREAGLPGVDPKAILRCHHKLHARQLVNRLMPEAGADVQALDWSPGQPLPMALSLPRFIKPVRSAFSVLARRIDTPEELTAHLHFGHWERQLVRLLIEPFAKACKAELPQLSHPLQLMAEELVEGIQFNLDGWVDEQGCHLLGTVGAVMYPGTSAFQRWESPARLPPAVVERAHRLSAQFLEAIDFRLGCFNVEWIYQPATDRLTFVECNPRLASQFSGFYAARLGLDPHALAIGLALGMKHREAKGFAQQATAGRQRAAVAASLVWRVFEAHDSLPQPSPHQLQQLAALLPEAEFYGFPKDSAGIQRDLKWLGSYRYGIVNLSAESWEALRRKAQLASDCLGWPNAPYVGAQAESEARLIAAA